MTIALHGIGASRGIAIGTAKIVEHRHPEVFHRAIDAEQVDDEVHRYQLAVKKARKQLYEVRQRIPRSVPAEIREFLDAHVLMLEDSTLIDPPIGIMRDKLCNAEWALKLQQDQLTEAFEDMEDPYLRSRQEDVNHVVTRIQHLLARNEPSLQRFTEGDVPVIVVADDVSPADVTLLQEHGVVGLVTEHSSPMSHTAIVARSLRLPAAVGVRLARKLVREGESLVIDGERGIVLATPNKSITQHYRKRQKAQQKWLSGLSRLRDTIPVSKDKMAIELQANVDSSSEAEMAKENGATGVGLYRTEYLFLRSEQAPNEQQQYEHYCDLIRALDGLPATIRTLDLGADKQGPSIDGLAEPNPALGLRGVRRCLGEPALFRDQLRAILRASAHGPVRILIPMLTNVQEVFQVRHLIKATHDELVREGHTVADHVPLGGMIEVPAAAIAAGVFAKYLDFLSIGTNDLIQYTLAIDRVDDTVSYLYDPLHPAVLKLLHMLFDAAKKRNTPVAMCGELAGDPLYTRLLMGLGLRDFSMRPGALLEVKQVVTNTDIGELKPIIRRILRATNPARLRELMRELNGL